MDATNTLDVPDIIEERNGEKYEKRRVFVSLKPEQWKNIAEISKLLKYPLGRPSYLISDILVWLIETGKIYDFVKYKTEELKKELDKVLEQAGLKRRRNQI